MTYVNFQYIRDHYGEDPAHYNKACNELEQLRQVSQTPLNLENMPIAFDKVLFST